MFTDTMSFKEAAEYFAVACRKNRAASVSTQTFGDWQVYHSRLLRCDERANKLTMEYPTQVSGDEGVKFTPGQALAIKFIANDHRLLFLAEVDVVHEEPCDPQPVRAIDVLIPDKLTCINQRKFFRVDIPKTQPLELEVWETGMQRLLSKDDEPSLFRGRALNVSIGGLLASGFNGNPEWTSGDHLGIKILLPAEVARMLGEARGGQADPDADTGQSAQALLLNAEVRHAWQDKRHGACFGLAFLGAETMKKTLAAQERLARLVAEYQRLWLGRRVG